MTDTRNQKNNREHNTRSQINADRQLKIIKDKEYYG